jgi:hypothetical protein
MAPKRSRKRLQSARAAKVNQPKGAKAARLARECGKLDQAYEKTLADEGLADDLRFWPDY